MLWIRDLVEAAADLVPEEGLERRPEGRGHAAAGRDPWRNAVSDLALGEEQHPGRGRRETAQDDTLVGAKAGNTGRAQPTSRFQVVAIALRRLEADGYRASRAGVDDREALARSVADPEVAEIAASCEQVEVDRRRTVVRHGDRLVGAAGTDRLGVEAQRRRREAEVGHARYAHAAEACMAGVGPARDHDIRAVGPGRAGRKSHLEGAAGPRLQQLIAVVRSQSEGAGRRDRDARGRDEDRRAIPVRECCRGARGTDALVAELVARRHDRLMQIGQGDVIGRSATLDDEPVVHPPLRLDAQDALAVGEILGRGERVVSVLVDRNVLIRDPAGVRFVVGHYRARRQQVISKAHQVPRPNHSVHGELGQSVVVPEAEEGMARLMGPGAKVILRENRALPEQSLGKQAELGIAGDDRRGTPHDHRQPEVGESLRRKTVREIVQHQRARTIGIRAVDDEDGVEEAELLSRQEAVRVCGRRREIRIEPHRRRLNGEVGGGVRDRHVLGECERQLQPAIIEAGRIG